MLYLNSVTMYIQCCLALWSCMPLIHLALVYIVYHFIRSQTVICHQSQTVTFVHDQKCFEIDLSNGQISSRMLLRIFNPLPTNTPYGANIYFTYPVAKIMPLYPNEAQLSGCTYTAPLSLAMEVMLTAYYTDG